MFSRVIPSDMSSRSLTGISARSLTGITDTWACGAGKLTRKKKKNFVVFLVNFQ